MLALALQVWQAHGLHRQVWYHDHCYKEGASGGVLHAESQQVHGV